MDLSASAILAVFHKNTAAERNAAAKEIASREERECNGVGRYLAESNARANYHEIYEWYADQEDEYEEEKERKANKCRLEKGFVQLTACAPPSTTLIFSG